MNYKYTFIVAGTNPAVALSMEREGNNLVFQVLLGQKTVENESIEFLMTRILEVGLYQFVEKDSVKGENMWKDSDVIKSEQSLISSWMGKCIQAIIA